MDFDDPGLILEGLGELVKFQKVVNNRFRVRLDSTLERVWSFDVFSNLGTDFGAVFKPNDPVANNQSIDHHQT